MNNKSKWLIGAIILVILGGLTGFILLKDHNKKEIVKLTKDHEELLIKLADNKYPYAEGKKNEDGITITYLQFALFDLPDQPVCLLGTYEDGFILTVPYYEGKCEMTKSICIKVKSGKMSYIYDKAVYENLCKNIK